MECPYTHSEIPNVGFYFCGQYFSLARGEYITICMTDDNIGPGNMFQTQALQVRLTSMGLLLGQAEAVAEAAAVLLGTRDLRRSW